MTPLSLPKKRHKHGLLPGQHGNDANIWSPPQVVALPFEVEAVHSFKPIWRNGCEGLYSKLNHQSKINGGSFPNNAVHQVFLFLHVILVSSDKASQGSNKMEDQYNISATHC